jgi:hypothetical protein
MPIDKLAGFVAVALLEGAISYLGGKLMASALGEATITDVHTWIRQAVLELEAFVSAKIDELVLQQMDAELEQLKQNILEYAGLPASKLKVNRNLIDNADTHSVALAKLALNHDAAFFISTASMAYLFFARTALFRGDGAASHIASIKGFVDEFLIQATPMYQRILVRLDPNSRIKIVCDEDPGLPGQFPDIPSEPGYYFCYPTVDGVETDGWSRDDTDENRARHAAQAYSDANIRPAVLKQFQKFQSTGLRALHLTADVYNRMCHKIGGNYTPPLPLPVVVSEVFTLTAKSTVLVPGAIVVRTGGATST